MTDHLRFSPDILQRLGEELVPDVDQGIIELVKNAYDADATECVVSILSESDMHSEVIVTDNGHGMTKENIREGWLVIGKSSKSETEVTTKFRRVPVGDKGLGRLAALRLGRRVELTTETGDQASKRFKLLMDWDEFSSADVVEEVDLDIQEVRSTGSAGTEIRISRIPKKLARGVVTKLARNLLLLSDPFRSIGEETSSADAQNGLRDPGFKASLATDEFKDLEQKVSQAYFSEAEYRIQCQHNEDGTVFFRLLDWKGSTLSEKQSETRYSAFPFLFDLWVFVLDRRSFSNRTASFGEVREWLSHVGGVHIYEDGIRVPPYGSPGDDWLELNLKRARSPEQRPSTNTAIGRVHFSNVERRMTQKTDRVGYIENEAFLEMKRCCSDALDWAATYLVRQRDERKQAEQAELELKTEKADTKLNKVLAESVSVVDRGKVEKAIDLVLKERGAEAKAIREDLQLYRSLATAGMTATVVAHEIGRPLNLIDRTLKALMRLIPAEKHKDAEKRVNRIGTATHRVQSFVKIPMSLLSKRKRRTERVSVNDTIDGFARLLLPVLEDYKIKPIVETKASYSDIRGSASLVEGVLLNLTLNSISAFNRGIEDVDQRRISISTSYSGESIEVVFQDNAGGIQGIDLPDIWLPGTTTDPNGTGFGLTIVRDSIKDLGGTVAAIERTDFGGAKFIATLPPLRELDT
ncbi:sensor histidine kinase [uncultured Roseobacter sp.]|uniref:sensor histidine kinase n=1 Tax=uncultured Roseobacter sp. TaxID=114847 RepID=UPI002602B62B|nr:sensor histidine kinase [uncultured Roseobacter sp.]